MYATCTFCHTPLGANEAIESFPVGRRLAFDAEKGRLWVVCGACKQWNLSPLDERWEAIESAEKLYRDTRLRASTDQVGLARVRDGTELIRVGRPLRPEFAAWRYGDRFSLRMRRYAVRSTIVGGGVAALTAFGWIAGMGFTVLPMNVVSHLNTRAATRRVIARFDDGQGPFTFTHWGARAGRIIEAVNDPLGWRLTMPGRRADVAVGKFGEKSDGDEPRITLTGADAIEVARRVLPHINRSGARRATVQGAVQLLEAAGDLDATFRSATRIRVDPYLGTLPAELRLALEMAAHEDLERRALEGELTALEASWKEAEEVAAIADSLTLPEWVSERIRRLGVG
ncbi:MAG: hypothetical protein K8S21_09305 [Gemmatimonadetes bacterium]|nr:hypothetical protein [Gemmatimonadota bacterium]